MSILESFSVSGALLTVGTTHHGELKTLKYCNEAFKNACMEYDEVHLKPTYKILWGVPGCSKAINIAERLGMLEIIVTNARNLYGAASAEIDEVIFASEKSKQDVEVYVRKAHLYMMLSKDLHGKLLLARRTLAESRSKLSNKKMQRISEIISTARSTLHKIMRQYQASAHNISRPAQPLKTEMNTVSVLVTNQLSATDVSDTAIIYGGEPCISLPQYILELLFLYELQKICLKLIFPISKTFEWETLLLLAPLCSIFTLDHDSQWQSYALKRLGKKNRLTKTHPSC